MTRPHEYSPTTATAASNQSFGTPVRIMGVLFFIHEICDFSHDKTDLRFITD